MDTIKRFLPKGIYCKRKIIIILILILIITISIITTIPKTSKKIKGKIFYLEPKNANNSSTIQRTLIKKPKDNAYSISLFINIKDWYDDFQKWKHVYHIGSKVKDGEKINWKNVPFQSPGLWLSPRINNMRFVFSTHDNHKVKHRYMDIEDIPINKVFNVTIVANFTSLTIFIDGKLSKTLLLSETPIFSCGNMYLNYNGGFNGTIQKLQYFDRELSIREIKSISKL